MILTVDEIRDSLWGHERRPRPSKVVEHHRRGGVRGAFRLGIPTGHPARVRHLRDTMLEPHARRGSLRETRGACT